MRHSAVGNKQPTLLDTLHSKVKTHSHYNRWDLKRQVQPKKNLNWLWCEFRGFIYIKVVLDTFLKHIKIFSHFVGQKTKDLDKREKERELMIYFIKCCHEPHSWQLYIDFAVS